jgi:uncharacterized protein
VNEGLPSPKMALKLLSDAGCSERVIAHCKAVSALAVKFAEACQKKGVSVDVDLVRIGGLLHDIGRSRTHDVSHAVAGVEIARSLKLPEPVVSIIERHIGGGISADEALKLGLPAKDYFPLSLEEKLVAYADKLLEGSKVVPLEKTVEQFSQKLGAGHPSIDRIISLHDELVHLVGDLDAISNSF